MKKYLLILLGILMAILYQHPASVLAEEAQKITVSYQYIDEDTGEIFREEKRNTDKQAGKAYEATPRWEEKYGLEKKEVVQERIDGDSGTAYMYVSFPGFSISFPPHFYFCPSAFSHDLLSMTMIIYSCSLQHRWRSPASVP